MEEIALALTHHARIIDHGSGSAIDPGLGQFELARLDGSVGAVGDDRRIFGSALPGKLVVSIGTLKVARVGVHVAQGEIGDVVVGIRLRQASEELLRVPAAQGLGLA